MAEKPTIDDYRVKHAGVKDPRNLLDALLEAKQAYENASLGKTLAYEEYEFLRKILGPELMGDETLIKWKDCPFKLQQQGDIYASAADGVTEEMKDWLFENDGEALVKDTVNASSLKSYLRKRIAAGKPIPAEHFNVEPYDFVKVVKA